MNQVNRIEISKSPSFVENWHSGSIEYNGKKYEFWLINPVGTDDSNEYACEVRWWFKSVPREVRMMHTYIIESFLQTLKIN